MEQGGPVGRMTQSAQAEIDFGRDGEANRENDLPLARRKCDGAFEAGRPGGRKELLRIGADARGAGGLQA